MTDKIPTLKWPEMLRLRPGMYIGGTDESAFFGMLDSIFDYLIIFNQHGNCSRLSVTLRAGNQIIIQGDGVELPIPGNESEHWNMDFWVTEGQVSIFGYGVANAFSSAFTIQSKYDGNLWEKHYAAGLPQSELMKVRELSADETLATILSFTPDPTIFAHFEISYEKLAERLREIAWLTSDLTVTLRDERVMPIAKEVTFRFTDGVGALVHHLNAARAPLHKVISGTCTEQVRSSYASIYETTVEVVIQYTQADSLTELSYCNTKKTPDGGTHLRGLHSGLVLALNSRLKRINTGEVEISRLTRKDIMVGLTAVVSVTHSNPQYESATTNKLANKELITTVSTLTQNVLTVNPEAAKVIIENCLAHRSKRVKLDRKLH